MATLVKRERKRTQNVNSILMLDGALGEIRTPDPRNRNPMLYPAELRARLLSDYQTWGQINIRPGHFQPRNSEIKVHNR